MATNQLMEYLKGRKARGFTPHPFYSREGDFLTYYFQDADHYALRIDEILTVYLSMEGTECVGIKLKGVQHLLDTLGDFVFQVKDGDGDLRLGMLFLAGMALTNHPPALEYYQRFAQDTKKVRLKRKELQPA